MRIFDAHCHYNLPPFSNESPGWQSFWLQAQECSIVKSMNIGTNVKTSQLAIQQTKQTKNLYASVGIHPGEVLNRETKQVESVEFFEGQVEKLKEMIQNNTVTAIGEVGLDYYWLDNIPQRSRAIEVQKKLLSLQLDLAEEFKLPVIFHMRDVEDRAYLDLLPELRKRDLVNFILHAVSGPDSYIQEVIMMGGYFSFAGNVTYGSSELVRQIAQAVPQDKILIETDAPYLAPSRLRGNLNEPKNIRLTAKYMQKELGLSLETIYQNTLLAFNLESKND